MLFFLDVISPIPEFFIIEDNKVIFRRKIIKNENDKLSDYIFETYINMDKDLNLTKNLKKIAMIIGPGSYTSLRVGASFLSGLKISKNIPFCSVSLVDIFQFKFKNNKIKKIGIYISSSKKQNFFCILNNEQKIKYIKIENNNYVVDNDVDTLYYNDTELVCNLKNIKQNKFSFIDQILENYKKLEFSKEKIIKPIYISNNKILN